MIDNVIQAVGGGIGLLLIILGLYVGGKAFFRGLASFGHESQEELREDGFEELPAAPYPTSFDDPSWGIYAPGEEPQVPAFIRHQEETLHRPRRERE